MFSVIRETKPQSGTIVMPKEKGYYKEKGKQQMLMRMWRNRSPFLLVDVKCSCFGERLGSSSKSGCRMTKPPHS